MNTDVENMTDTRQPEEAVDVRSPGGQRSGAVTWLLILSFCILAVLQTARLLPRLDDMLVNEDGAIYMLLGESLASGSGYRQLSAPGDPAHVLFPPGLPVALAGLRLAGFESVAAAKRFILILGLAAVPLTFLFLQPRGGTVIAALIAGWMILHPDYLRSASKVSTDIPHLFLSLLALLAIHASARRRGWGDAYGVLAWVSTVAAALTRAVGLPLAALAPIYLAWCKATPRWRSRVLAAALLAVCYGSPLVVWEGWKAANASPEIGGYSALLQQRDFNDWDKGKISGVGDLARRYLRNTRHYLRGLGALILESGSDRQKSLTGVALLGLIAAGMITMVRRGQWLTECYLLLAAVATITHPMPQLPRYLLPMLPFLLFYPAILLTSAGASGRRAVPVVLVLAIVAGVVTHDVDERAAARRPAFGEYQATASWLGENTPPDAVVLCRKPALMYLWSDRKSIPFPLSRDPLLTDERVRKNRVTHVVVDGFSSRTKLFLAPWVSRRVNGQAPLHRHGDTTVWRLDQDALEDLPLMQLAPNHFLGLAPRLPRHASLALSAGALEREAQARRQGIFEKGLEHGIPLGFEAELNGSEPQEVPGAHHVSGHGQLRAAKSVGWGSLEFPARAVTHMQPHTGQRGTSRAQHIDVHAPEKPERGASGKIQPDPFQGNAYELVARRVLGVGNHAAAVVDGDALDTVRVRVDEAQAVSGSTQSATADDVSRGGGRIALAPVRLELEPAGKEVVDEDIIRGAAPYHDGTIIESIRFDVARRRVLHIESGGYLASDSVVQEPCPACV